MSNEPLIFQKLATQMSYLNERQKLLAQNIANVDTPGYVGKDLKKLNFDDMVTQSSAPLEMRTTSAKHLASTTATSPFAFDSGLKGLEKKIAGNNVVLDDEMAKVSDVGAQSQLNTTLFHKFNQLYRAAVDSKAS